MIMRTLFSFMSISADGYHAPPDPSQEWQTFGAEFADYSVEQLDEIDTLVLGRTTYEELAPYWTSALGSGFDPRIADRMNAVRKLVVSTSLREVSWLDSPIEVVGAERLAEEKAAAGKSIAIFGSSTLTAALLRDGLVDELRLMINPILLGGGRKLFDGTDPVPLDLARTRPFDSGNVLLTYRPVRD